MVSDRQKLAISGAVVTAAAILGISRAKFAAPQIPGPPASEVQCTLNTGSAEEIAQLADIPLNDAMDIVAMRSEIKRFLSYTQLSQIPSLTAVERERIRTRVPLTR